MIVFENVSKFYKKDWAALKNISFKIDKGEFVFLIGHSGAGKSTLLKLIYMELFPDEGVVHVDKYRSDTIKDREIPYLRRKIGVIFQDFKLLPDRNVFDNVAFALQVTGTPIGQIKKKTLDLLAEVRLSHKRNAYPYQLSGGEQQKVAIARALAREPFILLADEPTGNVDPAGTEEIMELLNNINAKGTAILMATHDLSLVESKDNRIIALEHGMMVDPQTVLKSKAAKPTIIPSDSITPGGEDDIHIE